MKHARDAEESEEITELFRRCLHPLYEMFVKALGIETRDLIVLAAMVEDYLATCILEIGKSARPCADICGIERIGYGGVVEFKVGGGVRGTVDDVFEPFLAEQWY